MEEIDLKELLDFFKKKIGLMIVITMSVCLIGCIYGFFLQKPMFKSYTTIILSGSDNSGDKITQSDINLGRTLVDTYSEIVKSKRVLEQVIESLNLDISYGELSSKITVSALNNTEIIKITVVDANPEDARDIANETAKFFSKEVVKLFNLNNVNTLDEAVSEDNPYNINIPKQLIIYILIGLVLASMVLFIIFYFDRSVKSVEQVEQKIKLPILGSVQEMTIKGGKRK